MLNVYNRLVSIVKERIGVNKDWVPDVVDTLTYDGVVIETEHHHFDVRLAAKEDVDTVYQIEKAAYEGISPWNRSSFVLDFESNRYAVYLLLMADSLPVAFVGTRFTVDGDVHITNIAVKPEYRYVGCATLLLQELETIALQHGYTSISLEVRRSNLKAIRLYQKLDFEQTNIRKRYYKPDNEDAIEMKKILKKPVPLSLLTPEYRFKRILPEEATTQAAAIAEIMNVAYEHASNWTVTGILEDIEATHSYYYGVYYQEKLCGFAGFQAVLDEATLTNIAIHPDYQRQGLSTRLFSVSKKDLEQIGVTKIFLEVREFNKVARSFYEKIGFVMYHRRLDYYTNPIEDAILYVYEEGK